MVSNNLAASKRLDANNVEYSNDVVYHATQAQT